jgi:hypothetical protein
VGVSDKIDTVAARLACPWARSPAAWATASRTLVSTYVCSFSGQNDDPTGGGDPFQDGRTQNWGHVLADAKQFIGDGDHGANELASMINAEGPGTNCRGFASGG